LSTGLVLITGGFDASHLGLSTAEVYDPTSGQFRPTGLLDSGRGEHTATLLDSGVLIVGGYEAEVPLPARALAELYDPANGTFSPAGPMAIPRGSHTATVLADGRLLIAGGFTVFPAVPAPTVPDAEVYDPAAGTFLVDASMVEARGRHAAAALSGGGVLFAGGLDGRFALLDSAEVYTTASRPSAASRDRHACDVRATAGGVCPRVVLHTAPGQPHRRSPHDHGSRVLVSSNGLVDRWRK